MIFAVSVYDMLKMLKKKKDSDCYIIIVNIYIIFKGCGLQTDRLDINKMAKAESICLFFRQLCVRCPLL